MKTSEGLFARIIAKIATVSILKAIHYADMIPFYLGENVFSEGIIFPAGSGMVPYALRSEMGEAMANVFLDQRHKGKTYTITANHSYSYADVADILSNISGRKVALTDPSREEFERHLRQRQVPEFAIPILAAFASDIRAGRFDIIASDLEYLLSRKPADLEESLKRLYEK